MGLTPVLTKRFATNQPWKIANYERLDGYVGLRAALRMAPEKIIEIVKESNLRGRGGAGFPTGLKWQFIPQPEPGGPVTAHYVVVNADEGEPGTCRDLPLMMNDPHSIIEGTIIVCYATRAERAFIYIRGEAVHAIRRVTAAVAEAYVNGYLGANILGTTLRSRSRCTPARGAYICGEETALLDSLEGKRGQPGSSRRSRPPTASMTRRRSSTTSAPWPASPTSCSAVPLGTSNSGPPDHPGPRSFPFPEE
jgi:NADH-quinone oxidoreductase subunit F